MDNKMEQAESDASPIVYIVDDEPSVRDSLERLLASEGLRSQSFATAREFLDHQPGLVASCLLLDVNLPDTDGLDVQQELGTRGEELPIIFMTGHATIPMTVKAMRAGAVEFLAKPFEDEALLQAVKDALEKDHAAAEGRALSADLRRRYELLTAREREVLQLAIGGLMNKQIAGELGTTEVTAKVHKRRVMEKMGARSIADLVGMAACLDIKASKMR
ncbi:response regulator transcription factor [Rhizobium halophilum]|uniref:response regulator transcription factor n=1 Tax=Rhizobium halophilum TaxID=2846852 RepID=UPI001EFE4AD3|nr:response regulator [Rhizobium halophilum]MCF6371347.1 response regulator [Rhizobium halophilum]